jgi:predicted O-methyltransferase YrrM
MFHNIPVVVQQRMRFLEEMDAQDRQDGTSFERRLKQIPPETGKFLAMLARNAPSTEWLEIGTSAGYSTVWLGLAAREVGARVTSYETLHDKFCLAEETIAQCDLQAVVTLRNCDARAHIHEHHDIGFCFLDADEDVYRECYEEIVPNLAAGGVIIADNATSHADKLQGILKRALHDERVDAIIVPIGKGQLFCRKL